MKNTLIKTGILFFMSLVLLNGCTGDFEEINTDPNNPTPTQVDPKFVLATALNRTILVTTNYQNIQLLNTDIYAQFYANDLGVTYNSYNQVDAGIRSFWIDIVYPYLNSLNTIIINFSDKPEYANIVQIARIWKSWLMLRATDFWGDIPYSQACNGSGKAAIYDKQEDVYNDIFSTLADAVTKFDESKNNPGNHDFVYGGDYAKWKRFANSLRLRMAIRISHVNPTKAKSEAEAAIAAGIISNSTEACKVKCDESSINSQNPIAYVFSQGGFGMSSTMYNILTGLGGQPWPTEVAATVNPATVDPRGPIMFDPSSAAVGAISGYIGRWTGTNPGLGSANIATNTNNNARIGKFVYGNKSRPFPIFKYSEVCFLIAEAKVRFPSWNTGGGTAESWYKEGIEDNMKEWGIPSTTITTYLENPQANVNGTTVPFTNNSGSYDTPLDKIITQKWIALFPEGGWEAWADHRRTQKPKFIPFESVNAQWFPGTYDGTDVPQNYIRRSAYPVAEQTLNKTNLDIALQSLGGSYTGYIRKPMWWDPYAENGSLKPGAIQ